MKYNDVFNNWMNGHLKRYCEDYLGKEASKGLEENGFFVTLMMDRERVGLVSHESEKGVKEWARFNKFYMASCRRLLGSGYNESRKRTRQPFVLVFLDAEGTADGRFQVQAEGLHFHSIWVVPDESLDPFKNWINDSETHAVARQKFLIKDIDVRPVAGTIERLISYSAKFGKSDQLQSGVSQLFDVYAKGLPGIDFGPMKSR